MSDRDALLSAIRADPDDDTPRLVFADWLDEHEPDAKPHAANRGKAASPSAWASLIRAECELARLEDDGSAAAAVVEFFREKDEQSLRGVRWERADPDAGRRIELMARVARLRRASARARKAGLPRGTAAGVFLGDWTHRGFPAEARIGDSVRLLAHLDEVRGACPPLRLTFEGVPPQPAELVSGGLLRWCRGLVLGGPHVQLLAAMSTSPDAAGVRSLWFAAGRGTADVVAAWLSSVGHWGGLRELQIGNYEGFGREGAVRLLRGTPHLRQLRRLIVRGDGNWTRHTVQELAAFTELRVLRLVGCGLDDAAARVLANMPGLAKLRWLDLENNRITGAGASALIASPYLRNLAILDLEGNPVRGLDRAALAGAPDGGLRLLGFHGCRLTLSDVTAVVTSPRVAELIYLDFDNNELPESAVARLVEGLGGRAPAVLFLMGNNIATAGAEALAGWPAAAQIDMLHLSGNVLSTAGAKALAGCPHLQQLNHLCAGVTHPAARAALKKQFGDRAVV